MHDALWMGAASLLNTLGMAWLALSQERHLDTVCAGQHPSPGPTPAPPTQHRWRLRGAALLALALGLCLWQDGAAFGSLLWLMLLSASALAVALQLSFGPGALRWLLGTPRMSVNR